MTDITVEGDHVNPDASSGLTESFVSRPRTPSQGSRDSSYRHELKLTLSFYKHTYRRDCLMSVQSSAASHGYASEPAYELATVAGE
jgi:hypothetical protein